jgi:hypothetical protein
VTVVSVFLMAVTVMSLLAGQTKQPPKKSAKSKKSGATLAKARADSIAAVVRADSIRRAAEAKALADSLLRERWADSLARRRADSLKTVPLRKVNNEAFGVGERLVFDVSYLNIKAGEAVMSVPMYDSVAGRKCYRVEFTVNSSPTFSVFYRVEDRYLTFIDIETIAPWKFEQHIREGTYRRDFVAEFDQRKGVAKTTEGEFVIPQYVHDIMSAFYFARTIDFTNFKNGDGVMLQNFYRDKSHDLMVKFWRREELEVAAGTFNTILVEPLVKEGGLFKSEGRIYIWLSDDERKIPVRVSTKVVIGSIDTELKSYSGLAGPLHAKIE